MTAAVDPTTDEGAAAALHHLSRVAATSIVAMHIKQGGVDSVQQLITEVAGLAVMLAWDVALAAPEWMTAVHGTLQAKERAMLGEAGAAESRAVIATLLRRFPVAARDSEVRDDE